MKGVRAPLTAEGVLQEPRQLRVAIGDVQRLAGGVAERRDDVAERQLREKRDVKRKRLARRQRLLPGRN